MDDRMFWLQVRRGLLLIVSAIEQRHGTGRSNEEKERTAGR